MVVLKIILENLPILHPCFRDATPRVARRKGPFNSRPDLGVKSSLDEVVKGTLPKLIF